MDRRLHVCCMSGVAAFETYRTVSGMTVCGRFQSSLTIEIINERWARNGKYLPVPGRLVAAYITNGITTGADPTQT